MAEGEIVGGMPGGVIVEVSVSSRTPAGVPSALRLSHLRELLDRCAEVGVLEDATVILETTDLRGRRRIRATAAGVRVPLGETVPPVVTDAGSVTCPFCGRTEVAVDDLGKLAAHGRPQGRRRCAASDMNLTEARELGAEETAPEKP